MPVVRKRTTTQPRGVPVLVRQAGAVPGRAGDGERRRGARRFPRSADAELAPPALEVAPERPAMFEAPPEPFPAMEPTPAPEPTRSPSRPVRPSSVQCRPLRSAIPVAMPTPAAAAPALGDDSHPFGGGGPARLTSTPRPPRWPPRRPRSSARLRPATPLPEVVSAPRSPDPDRPGDAHAGAPGQGSGAYPAPRHHGDTYAAARARGRAETPLPDVGSTGYGTPTLQR